MQIHMLFNVVLISLSLATLLITLVSYSVYKLRQLPTGQQSERKTIKVDGVFFKRFLSPELKKEYLLDSETEGVSSKKLNKQVPSSAKRNLGFFFLWSSRRLFLYL